MHMLAHRKHTAKAMHVHVCNHVCGVCAQESTRHTDAMDAITTYLGYGSYQEWDEDQRIEWLVGELQVGGRRC